MSITSSSLTAGTINSESVKHPPAAVDNTVATSERLHYLDAVRAIAMLSGVLLHAGLSYSVLLNQAYVTSNPTASLVADFLMWFVHTFRMPLFFIVAGFFAHYLIEKRGLKGFIKNRALRIGLTFIVFWPVVTAGLFGAVIYAIWFLGVDTPVANMIKMAAENPDAMQGQKPPIGTTHLWFIYYLIFFCALTALAHRFFTLSDKLVVFFSLPITWLILLPILTLPSLITLTMPHPAPESFVPKLWPLTYYGLFFFSGWVFYRNPNLLDQLKKYWLLMTVTSIIAYGVFYYLLPKEPITLAAAMASLNTSPAITWSHAIAAFATAILSWHLSVLCLLAAKRFFCTGSKALRYISDASYWIYLIHVPFIILFQAYFYAVEWPIWLEFSIISIGTFAIGLLSYAIIVRHTPIGWMLNGRKKPKAS